ncbi:MAG: hypothetical protein IH840_01055 [Candidatus Heimdallarchaeota archaeon]|nr:hypothetical protein [Candidatus Heimdallarchaeota archaeon]
MELMDQILSLVQIEPGFTIDTLDNLIQKLLSKSYKTEISDYIGDGTLVIVNNGRLIGSRSSPSRSFDELELTDLVLLGYLKLKGFENIEFLSQKIGLENRDIFYSLAKLSTIDEIKLNFEIQKNKTNLVYFVFLSRLSISLNIMKDQVLGFKKKKGILSQQIANLQLKTRLQLIAASLVLLRETTVQELSEKYLPSRFTKFENGIDCKLGLLNLISLIALDQSIHIQIVDDQLIYVVDYEVFEDISIQNIKGYEWVIYDEILGLLSSKNQINFSEILFSLEKTSPIKINNNDVMLILSNLVLSGKIRGSIINKQTIFIDEVNAPETKDSIGLNKIERMLLGYLISEKVPKLSNVAKILNTDVSSIESQLMRLRAIVGLKYEISRSNHLLISKMPILPPLTNPSYLPRREKIVFGHLSHMKKASLAQLSYLTNVLENKLIQILYELVGYGLFTLSIERKNYAVLDYSEKPQQAVRKPILQNDLSLESKLLQNIPESGENTVEEWAYLLSVSEEEVVQSIGLLIADKKVKIKSFDNSVFIFEDELLASLKELKCNNCGKLVQSSEMFCDDCGTMLTLCLICKSKIYVGDSEVKCPNCLQSGHEAHFQTWIQMRPECPACRRHLDLTNLILVKE